MCQVKSVLVSQLSDSTKGKHMLIRTKELVSSHYKQSQRLEGKSRGLTSRDSEKQPDNVCQPDHN